VTYQIQFSKGAAKQIKKLPADIKERIDKKVLDLAIEPRPNGVKKLQCDDNSYRIRVGDYRIIYEIEDDILLVTVIKIKHRNEVYRDKS
jgi:mRNA interferase RelE/StbE